MKLKTLLRRVRQQEAAEAMETPYERPGYRQDLPPRSPSLPTTSTDRMAHQTVTPPTLTPPEVSPPLEATQSLLHMQLLYRQAGKAHVL